MTLRIDDLVPADLAPLLAIVVRTGVFTDDEVAVAREVLEDCLKGPASSTYRTLVARDGDRVVGYLMYGETPMTRGTYDLYWMAVEPSLQGRGVGRRLCEAMEDRLRAAGGRLVRVETSGGPEYAATRAFYLRTGYPEHNRIEDFYWPGNALCTHVKVLT